MSKISLDLSKFKHVKTEKGTTTLKHVDGHELKVSHKSLSPEFQKQLSALSGISKDAATPTQKDELQHKADGGRVKPKSFPATNGPMTSEERQHRELTTSPEATKEQVDFLNRPESKHYKPSTVRHKAEGGIIETAKKMFAGEFGKHQEPSEQEKQANTKQAPQIDPEKAKQAQEGVNKAEGGEVQPPAAISQAPRGDLPAVTDVPTEVIPPGAAPDKTQFTKDELSYVTGQGNMPAGENYNDMYNKIMSQDLKVGMSEEQARTHALKSTEGMKRVDVQSSERLDQKQINDFNGVVQERQRLQALGVPESQLPPLPVLTPSQQQSMQMEVPQAVANQQQVLSQPQQQAKPNDMGMADTEGMMQKGLGQELAGIQQQAKAQGELGKQQAAVHDQRAVDEKVASDHYSHQYNDLMQERQNMIDDVRNGYIDPEKYWDNHSKIATGIGMILAGFNPTSNPNAAVNFLKFQMENNLSAQRENLGAKQNLLRANLAQFGEMRAATEMTRIMQNDIVAHQLDSAAGQAVNPIAKAAALQAAGKLRMETAPLFQQFAMRRAMMNLANQGQNPGAVDQMIGYMRVVNPEMAKEMESRYIPNIGMAKVPVPEGARNAITAYGNVERLINEAIKIANTPGTAMSPEMRMRGQTLMGELQSQIRTAEDQGVYKESEANFMKKLIGDNPAGFLAAIKTEPKLKEMLQLKHNELASKLNQYGLPVNNMALHEEEKPVTGRDGRQYVRQVINGKSYMVPVK